MLLAKTNDLFRRGLGTAGQTQTTQTRQGEPGAGHTEQARRAQTISLAQQNGQRDARRTPDKAGQKQAKAGKTQARNSRESSFSYCFLTILSFCVPDPDKTGQTRRARSRPDRAGQTCANHHGCIVKRPKRGKTHARQSLLRASQKQARSKRHMHKTLCMCTKISQKQASQSKAEANQKQARGEPGAGDMANALHVCTSAGPRGARQNTKNTI